MTDSHLLEVGSWLWAAEHYLYIIHFKVQWFQSISYTVLLSPLCSAAACATPQRSSSAFFSRPSQVVLFAVLSLSESRAHMKAVCLREVTCINPFAFSPGDILNTVCVNCATAAWACF